MRFPHFADYCIRLNVHQSINLPTGTGKKEKAFRHTDWRTFGKRKSQKPKKCFEFWVLIY